MHHQDVSSPSVAPTSQVRGDLPPSFSHEQFASDTSDGQRRSAPALSPPLPSDTLTVETWDPRLAVALQQLEAWPTANRYRTVGQIYLSLGVLDAAHKYLSLAVDSDPENAVAFDGLAKVWRQWGFSEFGLGDAHRARYHAPESAVVRNTLGTLLQAVGQYRAAEQAYEEALALDPRSPHILNNLCYLSFLQGRPAAAIPHCRAALEVMPNLRPARNNLALAYAAIDRMDLARREFGRYTDRATGHFNLGMVFMAKRQYPDAVVEFETAETHRPDFAEATTMKWRARELAEREDGAQ